MRTWSLRKRGGRKEIVTPDGVPLAATRPRLDSAEVAVPCTVGRVLPAAQWPAIVEAASFEAMKSHADDLIPQAQILWEGGGNSFLNKGTNGRWRDVAAKADLDHYDAKIKTEFSRALARWIENGRLVAGDPRQSG